MPTYLLRLDAVNFASSCYDTNDLSTIRGGSMMLSNAHELISKNQLPKCLSNTPISYGASHAIWEFTTDDDKAAEEIRQETLKAFDADPLLKHATFACAVTLKLNANASELNRLKLLNRWSQFQKPTVTPPSLPAETDRDHRKPYCEFDRIRPSVKKIKKGSGEYRVSASSLARRDYGKKQKRKFYNEAVNLPVDSDQFDWSNTYAVHDGWLHGAGCCDGKNIGWSSVFTLLISARQVASGTRRACRLSGNGTIDYRWANSVLVWSQTSQE